jgi:O-antigen ligase
VALALLLILALQQINSPKRVRVVLAALFIASLPVSIIGILQFFGLNPLGFQQMTFSLLRSSSTYGNPDTLGGFLSCSVFIAAGLALSAQRFKERLFYGAGLCANLWCVVASMTRATWIAVALGAVLCIFLLKRQGFRAPRAELLPLILAAGLAVLLPVGISCTRTLPDLNAAARVAQIFAPPPQDQGGQGGQVGQDAQSAKARGDFGLGPRLTLWRASKDAIFASPLIGRGFDTYRFYSTRYAPLILHADARRIIINDPHNLELTLLLGSGFIGCLSFLAFLGFVARSWWQTLAFKRKPRKVLAAKPPGAGSLASDTAASTAPDTAFGMTPSGATNLPAAALSAGRILITATGCALVSFLIWAQAGVLAVGSLTTCFVLLAIVLAPKATTKQFSLHPLSIWALRTTAVLLCAFTLAALVSLTAADLAFTGLWKGRTAEQRHTQALQAIRLNPFQESYHRDLAQFHLGAAEEVVRQARGTSQLSTQAKERAIWHFEQAISHYKAAVGFAPDYYENYLLLAASYNGLAELTNKRSVVEAALQAARQASSYSQKPFEAFIEEGYAQYLLGDKAQAQRALKQAQAINPASEASTLLKALQQGATTH